MHNLLMFSELQNFSNALNNDHDLLHSWHCNVAMWFSDNFNVVGHNQRNNAAQAFINHFFSVNYDWRGLMSDKNPEMTSEEPEVAISYEEHLPEKIKVLEQENSKLKEEIKSLNDKLIDYSNYINHIKTSIDLISIKIKLDIGR